MERLLAYMRYFRQHPPTHWIFAGFVGYKPPHDSRVMLTPSPSLPDEED